MPTRWSRACSASTCSWAMRPVGMVLRGAFGWALADVSNESTLAMARRVLRLDGAFRVLHAELGTGNAH
eukprot:7634550-Alexandrium_andersonii.AAC.1